MKKPEAVKIVRSKAPQWHSEVGSPADPVFDDFLVWLKRRHPDILSFRSVMGPYEDLEMEWADVLKQSWRY